ncbi:hypothetical protein [Streptomyces viridosporus]|uniref:hypothetical protein n=1 Tax=Streptomyces viridosporus TaxID=67581 RepID=UPI0036FC11B1
MVREYPFTLEDVPCHARLPGFTADGTTYRINTWYRPEAEAAAPEAYGKVEDDFAVL